MPKQRKGSESEESEFQEKAANKKTKKVHKEKKSAKKKAQSESEEEVEVKNTPSKQVKKKKKPVEKEPAKPKAKNQDDDFIIGQKHEMPEDDDGARAFYSSLFQQNPNSDIAKKYCLEYGLMLPDVAQKVYKQLHKKGSA